MGKTLEQLFDEVKETKDAVRISGEVKKLMKELGETESELAMCTELFEFYKKEVQRLTRQKSSA